MEVEEVSRDTLIPQSAVEHALLEADKEQGVFDFLSFDSDLYDILSKRPDSSYLEKVYRLATVQNKTEFLRLKINDDVTKIYKMRFNHKWTGPDSVYDAWLLVQGYEREWFPKKKFLRKYPNVMEEIEKAREMYQHCTDTLSSDEEPDQTQSLEPPPKKLLTESQIEEFFRDDDNDDKSKIEKFVMSKETLIVDQIVISSDTENESD